MILLQENHGSQLGVGLEMKYFFQGVYILFGYLFALHIIP